MDTAPYVSSVNWTIELNNERRENNNRASFLVSPLISIVHSIQNRELIQNLGNTEGRIFLHCIDSMLERLALHTSKRMELADPLIFV